MQPAELTLDSVVTLAQIRQSLEGVDALPLIEQGFVEFSAGRAVVPPAGELIFDAAGSDSHIKFGFVRDDTIFVVKVANYFPANLQAGTPADDGAIMVFDQRTGALRAVLQDHGYLTRLRTGIAGAIAAKFLAPRRVERIGIIGTGSQARMQLQCLKQITPCRRVSAFGRDTARVAAYCADMATQGFEVEAAASAGEVASRCNLIVTCTTAHEALLTAGEIKPGTHITAVGADSAAKQELDPHILQLADIVAVDSIGHTAASGELHRAIQANLLRREDVVELGQIIQEPARGRTAEEQITVTDLVGLAVQDIQIAKAVLQGLTARAST